MPTVLRQDGFEVVIYTNDHPPAHVHVFNADSEAIINLGDEDTLPSLREVIAMKKKDVRKSFAIILNNRDFLLEEWRRIHG